jgi:hypothetical protein
MIVCGMNYFYVPISSDNYSTELQSGICIFVKLHKIVLEVALFLQNSSSALSYCHFIQRS